MGKRRLIVAITVDDTWPDDTSVAMAIDYHIPDADATVWPDLPAFIADLDEGLKP